MVWNGCKSNRKDGGGVTRLGTEYLCFSMVLTEYTFPLRIFAAINKLLDEKAPAGCFAITHSFLLPE